MAVQSYRDLVAWRKAMDLVKAVYALTRMWPREEVYGLTSQIRRAAVSIPSNIAEGQGRRSSSEFRQHLSVAHGSLMELETQVLIARELEYITSADADAVLARSTEVARLINGLRNSLPSQRSLTTDH